MNKFICALLVTVASMMNADMLLNAINRHDLQKVTALLKQQKYDPILYVLYINSAREMVEKCRNDLLIQSLNHGMDPILGCAGNGCVAASLYPIYQICITDIYAKLTVKQADDLKTSIAALIGLNFLAGVFFGLAIIIRDSEVETAYNEAVKIQQLILELPYG